MEIKLLNDIAPTLVWEENGLNIPEETTQEEVASILRNFSAWNSVSSLALADVLAFARARGYLEQLELVFAELDISPVDVSRALSVADVPRALRNSKLSAEHYYVVSRLTYDQQIKWLDLAVKHSMSGLVLKRSIEAGAVLSKDEIALLSGRGSGIQNYQGLVNNWSRWSEKVGGAKGISSWPIPVLSQWIEDFAPIVAEYEIAKAALKGRIS